MKSQKTARIVVTIVALLALLWWIGGMFTLGRSVWAVFRQPGPVVVGFSSGAITLRSSQANLWIPLVSVLLTTLIPLGVIALAGVYLRFASFRWPIGVVAVVAVGFVAWTALEHFSPHEAKGRWVGHPMPALDVDYIATKPEVANHPILLEFWATWCGPCMASIPHLNELNAKYKDAGLVIVAVSSENRVVVERFLKRKSMDYTIAVDRSRDLTDFLGVTAIPHAMLADRSGRIVWEGHPAALKDSQIAAVLK